jgi:hypothetical protein
MLMYFSVPWASFQRHVAKRCDVLKSGDEQEVWARYSAVIV